MHAVVLRSLCVICFACLSASLAGQSASDISRVLDQNKSALRIDTDSLEYAISNAYENHRLGLTHVYLEQRYRDIPVYNGILNLNLDGDRLVSFGNRWVPEISTKAGAHTPSMTAQSAVTRVAADLGFAAEMLTEVRHTKNAHGHIVQVVFARTAYTLEEIPATLVWTKHKEKEVLLTWMVDIHELGQQNVWRMFVDAHSGAIVQQDNLVLHCEFDRDQCNHTERGHSESDRLKRVFSSQGNADAPRIDEYPLPYAPCSMLYAPLSMPYAPDSSYNVFAMPVESPNHGDRSIAVTPWHDAGSGNEAVTLGWHSNGTTNYTITRGNNVHAYEDINNDGIPGFNPDTSNLRFDYPFDPYLDPEDNMAAAVTNLFYWNNIIHDVLYQYGFDEPSGNFQVNNLGRGGNSGDDVRAEALDGGGTNNANFFTPSDGSRPRMQMYVWSTVSDGSPLTINSPEQIAGDMYAVESAFSNNNDLDDIGLTMGDLVLVDDEGASTHLACGNIENGAELDGKVALIDRGECNFTVKVKKVQDLGAIAAIVINNVSGAPFGMGGTDNSIVIPAVMISLNNGNLLKDVLDTATINVSMDAVDGVTPDGDYDSGIIAHEYGHGVSIRLTGGASNVGCLDNAEQMGEGWSDYFGLMLTTDWTEATPTERRGIGTYVLGEETDGDGIRTYPYTTDTLINPFTYASIGNSGGSVHYVGSVWCTMLWDMTWRIIEMVEADPDIYHGTGGNNIALQLVMDGLKLQPCNPGFVDGRDAILLADQLRYDGQFSCAIWEAFARRGLGVNASQGSSNNYQDGVESFSIPTGVNIESKADTVAAGEGQELTFTIKVTCGCEGKSDLVISDILSEDLIYVPGSGGTLSGDTVTFTADTLSALDSLVFTYRAIVGPCSASEPVSISQDNADGTDQYQSFKLAGTGTRQWIKSTAQFVSSPNSWYARDYTSFCDYVLRLINPLEVDGPVEIAFDHRYETEATYDGGVVEYSLDGTTWIDAGPYFIENGYPSAITNTNSNIAGRDAFTGNSNTQFSTNTFVHSAIRLNLGGEQSLRVRFRFACDGSLGGPGINGWYIDNIVISQLSGVSNQTRVTSDMVFVDSLFYGVQTSPFSGNMYVDQTASGNRSGISWEHAMPDFLFALEVAGCHSTDSIFLAEGTYLPNFIGDRQLSFHIPDSTRVFGGFPTGGSTFAMRDPSTYPSVLSGDIGIDNDATDNVYHVIRVDSAQSDILIDGVRISHGNADGAGDNGQGAGVFCRGGLTLQNVIFNNNAGLSDGQIIRIKDSGAHLILNGCTIYGPDNHFAKLLNSGLGQVTMDGSTEFLVE